MVYLSSSRAVHVADASCLDRGGADVRLSADEGGTRLRCCLINRSITEHWRRIRWALSFEMNTRRACLLAAKEI